MRRRGLCGACYYRQRKAQRKRGVYRPIDNGSARLNVYDQTDGACMDLVAPCDRIDCRYNVIELESIRVGRPAEHIQDATEPCALRLADRGGMTLQEVADVIGVSRERIRQIEESALRRMRRALAERGYTAAV